MKPSGKLSISLVNVPADVSPLKLRGFLRAEAEDIQRKATEHSLFIVRLFLPERLLFAVTQKKVDVLLQDITNKYESIQRVELVVVKQSLNAVQMMEEAKLAEEDMKLLLEDAKAMSDSMNGKSDKTIH
jgi:hypothetical protein